MKKFFAMLACEFLHRSKWILYSYSFDQNHYICDRCKREFIKNR